MEGTSAIIPYGSGWLTKIQHFIDDLLKLKKKSPAVGLIVCQSIPLSGCWIVPGALGKL